MPPDGLSLTQGGRTTSGLRMQSIASRIAHRGMKRTSAGRMAWRNAVSTRHSTEVVDKTGNSQICRVDKLRIMGICYGSALSCYAHPLRPSIRESVIP